LVAPSFYHIRFADSFDWVSSFFWRWKNELTPGLPPMALEK
jgi:hypothetical protein